MHVHVETAEVPHVCDLGIPVASRNSLAALVAVEVHPLVARSDVLFLELAAPYL